MQIVIELDKDITESLNDGVGLTDCQYKSLVDAITNGTPLSKGHGDLKDIGKCNRKLFYKQCGGADSLITAKSAFDMLMSLPTIIKADAPKRRKGTPLEENDSGYNCENWIP